MIEVDGRRLTLVDDALLGELASAYRARAGPLAHSTGGTPAPEYPQSHERAGLRLLRNRESRRRAVLHDLRHAARARLPVVRHARPRRGALLHELRQRARRGAPAGRRPPPARGAPAAEERRQVTVLFADLSGYTAVAERMDPEAVKSLVDRALMRLGAEVERYGGTVDKYIGDNVMAIFGAPLAHEDDEERAVRAGLGMQAAMAEVNAGLPPGVDFDLRVGINTGEVLAGAVGESYTVTGDTVNVASRLQSAARPGSVTVGERTMRATRGAVRLRGARAARPEGQGRAGARLGGRRPHRRAQRPAAQRRSASRRSWGATTSWSRSRRSTSGSCARARPHLVTPDRRGRRGQVAAPARVRARPRRALDRPRPCAPAAASPTAPASSSGRSARSLRAECGIVDTDSSEEAWRKLSALRGRPVRRDQEPLSEPGEREAALIGRLLGIEVPPELGPDGARPRAPARGLLLRAARGHRGGSPRGGRS